MALIQIASIQVDQPVEVFSDLFLGLVGYGPPFIVGYQANENLSSSQSTAGYLRIYQGISGQVGYVNDRDYVITFRGLTICWPDVRVANINGTPTGYGLRFRTVSCVPPGILRVYNEDSLLIQRV